MLVSIHLNNWIPPPLYRFSLEETIFHQTAEFGFLGR